MAGFNKFIKQPDFNAKRLKKFFFDKVVFKRMVLVEKYGTNTHKCFICEGENSAAITARGEHCSNYVCYRCCAAVLNPSYTCRSCLYRHTF